MARTARRTGVAQRLQRVQADAERALSRGYRAALDVLPPSPRKAVKRLASQIEDTADELIKRRRQTAKAVAKQRKLLSDRVGDIVHRLERSRDRALATAERRGTAFIDTVEGTVAAAIRPMIRRLNIVTVRDLEQLSRRLADVERKLNGAARRRAA